MTIIHVRRLLVALVAAALAVCCCPRPATAAPADTAAPATPAAEALPPQSPAPGAGPAARAKDPNRTRTIAIFVKNRADKVLDEKVGSLEEQVASKLAERFADKDVKLSIISREDALNAVASFAGEGANKGDAGKPGADLDAILSNSTSALRLAQNLNADYILTATITAFTRSTKEYTGNGIHTLNIENKIRLSYKMLDTAAAGTFDGGTAEGYKIVRETPDTDVKFSVPDDLLSDASDKLAEKIADRIKLATARAGEAPAVAKCSLTVVCTLADLTIPDVVKDDKGDFSVTASKYDVSAPSATLELNGLVIGTAPGTFEAPKGINKLRVTREGCRDWERTINVSDGMKLNVALQMSDAGFARWKETVAFLQAAKAGAKLTDAQAEAVRGFAQMLRQSGYKVDIKSESKSDTKIDTDLKGVTFQSIFR